MKILFLDEAGDHDLLNLDKHFPIFVLTGCIIDEDHHRDVLTKKMNQFKQELFGRTDIILHYADYTRNQHGFERVKDKTFREEFFRRLNLIIESTEAVLLACIIDKKEHSKKYGLLALDPYHFSLQIVVERFIHYLKTHKEKGFIIAESRGKQFDNELELVYLDLKINGTNYCKANEISEWISGFAIKKKSENVAGLQFTDTLATPIGRKYLRRRNYYLNYKQIESKFRKHPCGKYKGYGLIILPK